MIALACLAHAGCAQGGCPDCPTASLLANGAPAITVHAGDAITYAWDSTNADTASSTVAMQPAADSCGNVDGPWVVATLRGSSEPAPVLACQAGTAYTLTFSVGQAASTETARATVTVTVQ